MFIVQNTVIALLKSVKCMKKRQSQICLNKISENFAQQLSPKWNNGFSDRLFQLVISFKGCHPSRRLARSLVISQNSNKFHFTKYSIEPQNIMSNLPARIDRNETNFRRAIGCFFERIE